MPLGLIVGCGFWPFSRAISSRLSATSHFLDNAMLAVCHLTADPTATPNEPMVLTRSIAGLGRALRMIFLTIEGRRR